MSSERPKKHTARDATSGTAEDDEGRSNGLNPPMHDMTDMRNPRLRYVTILKREGECFNADCVLDLAWDSSVSRADMRRFREIAQGHTVAQTQIRQSEVCGELP